MRVLLLVLTSLVSLTAIPFGLMMMISPDGSNLGLSTALLANTPFATFFLPGLVLTVIVGGIHMAALFLIMDEHPAVYRVSLTAGVVLIAWIIVQAIFLMTFFWLHGLYLFIGILTAVISYQLQGKAAF